MEIRGIGNLLGKSQHGHLQAIGLQLYLRLVEQTVTEIKNNVIEPVDIDVQINLPVTFYIPESLITSQESRLNFYQKLSHARSRSELNKIITKKFNEKILPTEFTNLLDILELKLLAQGIGIYEISLQEKNKISYIVLYSKNNFTAQQLQKIKTIKFPWQVTDKNLKIEISKLGQNWLAGLLRSIQALH